MPLIRLTNDELHEHIDRLRRDIAGLKKHAYRNLELAATKWCDDCAVPGEDAPDGAIAVRDCLRALADIEELADQ